MTCTVPEKSRRRMVRIVIASTTPELPLRSMTSPTCTWSSIRMNRPVMTSFTSVCAPKPTASPMTPAPASSGPMSTPISDSTISVTISRITHHDDVAQELQQGAAALAESLARRGGVELALDGDVGELPGDQAAGENDEDAGQHPSRGGAGVRLHEAEHAEVPALEQRDDADEP
jgi:hypothetical protein